MNVKASDNTDDDARTDGGSEAEVGLFTRTAEDVEQSRADRLRRFFRLTIYAPLVVAWTDLRTRTGVFLIGGFIFLSTIGTDWIQEPSTLQGQPFQTPFHEGWLAFQDITVLGLTFTGPKLILPLGTDDMGRDMLAQLVHASPAMLKMVVAGAVLSVGVGTLIGLLSGYSGGTLDYILMLITDTVLVIPALVLIIVISAVWAPRDPFLVGLLLGIDNWPNLARNIRSQVLSIREEDYTEASRAMGLSRTTILRKDMFSNMAPYILINLAQGSRRIIFESVGLYFLGILPFTTLNWGVMMNQAYHAAEITDLGRIHWLYLPMLMIIFVSLGFLLFAQGTDRLFNVRLRAKHAQTDDDDEEEVTVQPQINTGA